MLHLRYVSLALGLLAAPSFAQCELVQLTSSDAEFLDVFGWSVDLEGPVAVIGSIGADDLCPSDPNCDSGAAHVFIETPMGWTEVQKLAPSDGAPGDQFGQNVSVSGDRILVGSHLKGPGAAYMFVRSGNTWVEEQKLLGSDSQQFFHFGHSLQLDGDTALIGVMRDDYNGPETGSAFIFERVGGTWQETAKLTASDGATLDRYARSSSYENGVAVLGAHLHDGIGADSGAAYVYERDDNGTPMDPLDDAWPEVAALAPNTPVAGAFFGRSVAVSGDTIVVGASRDPEGSLTTGAAYVFERTPMGWTQTQRLIANDASFGDAFGESVAIEGDRIVVGAVFDADFGGATGSAYLFERTPTGWVQTQKFLASDAAGGQVFGAEMTVAVSGTRVIGAAPFNGSAAPQGGAAYIFETTGCLGTSYCNPVPNSTGVAGLTVANGSTVTALNALTVSATQMPASSFGFFIVSRMAGFAATPGGSQGNICLGGQIGRYVNDIFVSDPGGSASLAVDFTAIPSPTGPSAAVAGETLYFQAWHRDSVGGMAVSNFTRGLEVELH